MDWLTSLLGPEAFHIAVQVLAAIIFWIVGRWIIGRVTRLVQLAMNRRKVDEILVRYAGSILGVLLNIVLVIGILGHFGFQTTSIAALLAGAGLAIGTAWGGLLSNFAAGAFLVMLRPFKVGDAVTAGGITGTVTEVGMFVTTITSPDNVKITVGNNKILGGDIFNFTANPVRRVERTAQLAGSVDPLDAVARFKAGLAKIPNVAASPAPEVSILDFTLSGPVIAVRPYTHNDNYWQVYFDTNAMIAKVGKEAGWPAPAESRILKQM